jgi:hypothetical protein
MQNYVKNDIDVITAHKMKEKQKECIMDKVIIENIKGLSKIGWTNEEIAAALGKNDIDVITAHKMKEKQKECIMDKAAIETIKRLARIGWTNEEIARSLGVSKNEVELTLEPSNEK